MSRENTFPSASLFLIFLFSSFLSSYSFILFLFSLFFFLFFSSSSFPFPFFPFLLYFFNFHFYPSISFSQLSLRARAYNLRCILLVDALTCHLSLLDVVFPQRRPARLGGAAPLALASPPRLCVSPAAVARARLLPARSLLSLLSRPPLCAPLWAFGASRPVACLALAGRRLALFCSPRFASLSSLRRSDRPPAASPPIACPDDRGSAWRQAARLSSSCLPRALRCVLSGGVPGFASLCLLVLSLFRSPSALSLFFGAGDRAPQLASALSALPPSPLGALLWLSFLGFTLRTAGSSLTSSPSPRACWRGGPQLSYRFHVHATTSLAAEATQA